MLLSRITNIRTGRKRKTKLPGPDDDPFKQLFNPSKGKRGKAKGQERPKEGKLTAVEQWGQKKGQKPKTPYLHGTLGCNNLIVVYPFNDYDQSRFKCH